MEEYLSPLFNYDFLDDTLDYVSDFVETGKSKIKTAEELKTSVMDSIEHIIDVITNDLCACCCLPSKNNSSHRKSFFDFDYF